MWNDIVKANCARAKCHGIPAIEHRSHPSLKYPAPKLTTADATMVSRHSGLSLGFD